ncbi:MAG: CvpA family protein [Flavobacterium sp.]
MEFIDIIIGGFLLYGFLRGVWNGLFVELASFLSLLVGIWAALKFSNTLNLMLQSIVSWSPKTIMVVSFALTFILVFIAITMLAKVFTTLFSFAGLGIFNKILGGVFGIFKMVLIVGVSLGIFEKVNFANHFAEKETLEKSLFYFPVLNTATSIYPSLQEWLLKQDFTQEKTDAEEEV